MSRILSRIPRFLLLAALLGACTNAPTVVTAPRAFPGFPSSSTDERIWAEAIFYANHEDVFGTDLLREGLLPVALRVGVRDSDEVLRLTAESFDARLYLQDGTSLAWVPYETIDVGSQPLLDRIAERALRPSVIESWSEARESFLYFRVDAEAIRVQEAHALTQQAGSYREVDLLQSLLFFQVSSDSGNQDVRVGLRGGRHTGP